MTVAVDTRGTTSTGQTPMLLDLFSTERPEFVPMSSLSFFPYRLDASAGGAQLPPPASGEDGDDARNRLIDELMAWATDPDTFEPEAVDRIRREAWGDVGV